MNLEEVYRLAQRAEAAKSDLEHETATYDMYLEMFYGDGERDISKQHLLDETRKMKETLALNEEILHDLSDAREYLADVNDYRQLNAEETVESLSDHVEELVDDYREAFYDAMEVAARPEKDASMPGPITMKSMDNLEDDFDIDQDLPQLMGMISR